jgi:hypothetical protein
MISPTAEEQQHITQRFRCGFEKLRNRFFAEGVSLHAVVGKSLFHLRHGVWIGKFRELLHFLHQFSA